MLFSATHQGSQKTRGYLFLGLLLLAFPLLGLGCQQRVTPEPVTLKYWRVFDGEDTMAPIISAYRQAHPYVTIDYRLLRYEEYEQQLLQAMAENRGPDLFSIHNTWFGEYQSRLAPLPPTTTTAEIVSAESFYSKAGFEERNKRSLTPSDVRQAFVDVVGNDVIRKDEAKTEAVYGLPLAVDTLTLFYNKDILNSNSIATPPTDWEQFLAAVAKISRLDPSGQIIVSGASLGTADNIPRFSDIIAALMMQNGADMIDANGFVTFHITPDRFPDRTFSPGLEALRFYTDFANPTREAYSWNNEMPDALEAFITGRSAFFFGYSYQIPTIRARAPQLHWGVTQLPQADRANNTVNIANYWAEVVAKNSPNQEVAWDFLQFAAKNEQAKMYLDATGKPPALRSLIAEYQSDPIRGPFTAQLLTAKSWYRGRDAAAAEKAFRDLVVTIPTLEKPTDLKSVVGTAVQRINQTIR